MSLMDKVKSFFSGGAAAEPHDHAGHDHAGHDHDHSHEPATAVPPADPAGVPTSDAGEERPV